MALQILVNIGEGNGLLPYDTKPLPAPFSILSNRYWGITKGLFHQTCRKISFTEMYLRMTQSNLQPYSHGLSKQHSSCFTYWVHFKVHQLPASEGNDDLSLVYSTFDDALLARSLPLVHTLVSSDVTDTVRVDLQTEENRSCKCIC